LPWFNLAGLKPTWRGLARQCLDWTERSHHLAGRLGSAFLRALCEKNWLRRSRTSRAVEVTPKGQLELKHALDIDARPGPV
jgi:hypothetical protein